MRLRTTIVSLTAAAAIATPAFADPPSGAHGKASAPGQKRMPRYGTSA